MPDPGNDLSAADAAEQAVAAGDLSGAASHLRVALARQEAELGPAHPDLASTLNNLGVVHERMGDFAAAERCYRRAYEMVTAAFPAGHPFVETSRQNLVAFCEARGIPFEVIAPPAIERPAPAPLERPAQPPVARPAPPSVERAGPPPVQRAEPAAPKPIAPPETAAPPARIEDRPAQSNERRHWRGLLIASAIAIVAIAAFWTARRGQNDRAAASPAPGVATQTPSASAPNPPPPAASPQKEVPVDSATASPALPSPPQPPIHRAPDSDPSVSVVDAKLCTELSRSGQWTCAPVADPVDPGM